MRVEIAYAGPGGEALIALDVAPGTTVEQSVEQSGVLTRVGVPRADLAYAVFGRRIEPTAAVSDGDRVEITRPLVCDPKAARRRRARRKD